MSNITRGTALVVIAAWLLAAAGVSAQRAARSSVNVNRSASANVNRNTNANVNRNTDANVNRNTNANINRNTDANVNRNTNVNVNQNANVNVNRNANVNVNRDIDVNVNHYGGGYGYGCCYHPVATAAAVTAAAVTTAVAVGSMVSALPPSCTVVSVNGVTYQQCGSTWYRPQFAGSSVTYVVIDPPR